MGISKECFPKDYSQEAYSTERMHLYAGAGRKSALKRQHKIAFPPCGSTRGTVTTTDCERCFSAMNRVNTELHNRMNTRTS